ncbi:hypothetical protein ACFO1B_43855 [Dactylosporangium siamense]|uniref:hypothetical protein n=1 Tax=Dactylosporangium siamense TaxID=685454 RepID=UPI00194238B3|nr:hypothetical protein [Dactylosporangium siamense]
MAIEIIHHWWNSVWGRLSRRDIYVRTDGATFEVEVRLGGQEGRQWRAPYPDLPAAVAEAQQHLTPGHRWVDIARAHQRAADGRSSTGGVPAVGSGGIPAP